MRSVELREAGVAQRAVRRAARSRSPRRRRPAAARRGSRRPGPVTPVIRTRRRLTRPPPRGARTRPAPSPASAPATAARALRPNHAAVASRSAGPASRTRRIAAARSSGARARGDEAVLAVVDQLGRGVVLAGDDDARRAARGRLDDDEPVALARRRQHHAERACAAPPRPARASTKPGASTDVAEPEPLDLRQHARRARARRRRSPRAAPARLARPRERRQQRRHALLGDVAAGEHDDRLAPAPAPARSSDADVLAASAPSARRAGPRRAAAPRAAARSRRRAAARARSSRCTNAPTAPPARAQVLAPVGARPHLVPVDDERVARRAASRPPPRAARSRGTRRCGRRRSGARAAAGATARRAPNTSGGRIRRRPLASLTYSAIRGPTDAHVDARHAGVHAAVPLAQRQVGDLVPVGREPLAEVAVPALGAADGVGEEAVVDEADAHARGRFAQRRAGIAAGDPAPACTSIASRESARLSPDARVAAEIGGCRAAAALRMSTTENTITAPPPGAVTDRPLVSVVIPCLNEAENIVECVTKAREALDAQRDPRRGRRRRQRLRRRQPRAGRGGRRARRARAAPRLRQRLPRRLRRRARRASS